MLVMTRNMFGVALAAAALVSSPLVAQFDEEHRVRESMTIVSEIMGAAHGAIATTILSKAEGIAVFPAPGVGSGKGEFVVGDHRRGGILSARIAGTRGWSAPAFMTIERGSLGEPQGAQPDDLLLIIVNRHSLEDLVNESFTMGPGAGVVPGPIGGNGAGSTGEGWRTGIFSYSRSRGALTGVSLNGALVRADPEGNRHFYGRALKTAEVVLRGKAGGTGLVRDWENLLARYAP
jgi:lipid-binding SYLF domain-containing protein